MRVDKKAQMEWDFKRIQEGVAILQKIREELDSIHEPGFEPEIASIRSKLKDLDNIFTTEAEFNALEKKIQKVKEQREEEQREEEQRKEENEKKETDKKISYIKEKIEKTEKLIQASNEKAKSQKDYEWLKVLSFLWDKIESFADNFNKGNILIDEAVKDVDKLYEEAKVMSTAPANNSTRSSTTGDYYGYYKVLGVRRDADLKEIKEAYNKYVKKWHPDLHQSDSEESKELLREKMEEINEANHVLSNNSRRKMYDEGKYRKDNL